MRYLGCVLSMVFVLCMGACTTQNPQQSVYQTAVGYKAALAAAVQYKQSPTAKPDVVKKLQQADDVAGPALKAAEATVRNPDFDKSTTSAVVTGAKEALRALTDILVASSIPIPPPAK